MCSCIPLLFTYDVTAAAGSANFREAFNGEGVGGELSRAGTEARGSTETANAGGGGGAGSGGSSWGGGSPAKRKVGLDSFKIVRVIGKGSFGKVGLHNVVRMFQTVLLLCV